MSVSGSAAWTTIVSGSAYHTLRLWNAGIGQPIGEPLTGHDSVVRSVAFSPDGHRIVSGSDDRTVRQWNADDVQPVGTPLNQTDIVTSVAFSPDGRRIVSAGFDKTLRLWAADTGQPVRTINTTDRVLSVAFSPDGKRLLAGSSDRTLQVWNVDTGQLVGTPLVGTASRPVSDSVRRASQVPAATTTRSGYDQARRAPELLCDKPTATRVVGREEVGVVETRRTGVSRSAVAPR